MFVMQKFDINDLAFTGTLKPNSFFHRFECIGDVSVMRAALEPTPKNHNYN